MFDFLRPKKKKQAAALNQIRDLIKQLKKSRYQNRYKATELSNNRAMPRLDHGSEEWELDAQYRLRGIAIGRDLHRNNSQYVTLENLRRVFTSGKVLAQFKTADEDWNTAAGKYFNIRFSRDCMYNVPRMNFAELCQHIEAAKMREGDCLVVYDDGIIADSGKIFLVEADQLVNVSDWSNPENPFRDYTQSNGVILDDFGRVAGYICTRENLANKVKSLHGGRQPGIMASLPLSQCWLVPVESAVLAMYRYRAGQIRGVPEFLPVSIELDDSDNMRKSELDTAKLASKKLGAITRSANTSALEASLRALKFADLKESEETEEKSGSGATETEAAEQKYTRYSDDAAAIMEVLDEGDDVKFFDSPRPNLDTQSFYASMSETAGAALGTAAGFSHMKVTNSYTAHRAESLLTWVQVENKQRIAEWQYLDWLAEKVILRAVRLGHLPPPPEDWTADIAWSLPKMPEIDPQKDVAATALKLKNGLTTYEEILGPTWRKTLSKLAAETAFARESGIPLAVLETVAGAIAANTEETQENEE